MSELAAVAPVVTPVAAGLAAAALSAWIWPLIERVERPRRSRRRTRAEPRRPLAVRSIVVKALARLAENRRVRELLAQVGPSEPRLRELVLVSGLSVRPRDLRGAQLAAACALAAVAMRLARGSPPPLGLALLAPAAWGGAMLPVLWLRRKGERRLKRMRAVLPDGLELVRACVAGGLPLRRSLAQAARHCREPLSGELAALVAATAAGAPLIDAVDEFDRRNPLPEVRALATAIRQAERHGAPLAALLTAIADDARRARERSIADRAAAAAPQIQLIVAALLVPAALLELAALLLAAFARGELTLL